MKTSYFAKSAKHPNAVSIAVKAPPGFTGRQYKKLAPKYWFFKKYKEDGDTVFYTEQFNREVLAPLNPEKIYGELGEEAVLLCWEGKNKFCHRHIVARWFEKNIGIKIEEIQ